MSKEREIGVDLAKQGKYKDALFFFDTAFAKGDLDALSDAGVVCERNKDYKTALNFYQKASMLGSGVATYNAGNLYENGKGAKKELYLSYLLYRKSAQQKYARAYYKLAKFYENGIVVKKDLKQAFKLIIEGTKFESKYDDDPACLITAGYYFEMGIGTKQNNKMAYKYYMKAVKHGSSVGMYNSALCLLYKNKKKNIKKGLDLLIKATEQKYPDAFAELSVIYKEGKFVNKDKEMSDYWLNEAMNNKSWRALLIFADMCLCGDGDEKKVDITSATRAISIFLANSGEYFEDYKYLYTDIKNEYKDLIDWENIEKDPDSYLEKDNKNCLA